MQTASWVVVSLATGQAALETFNPEVVACVNLAKYRAVPVVEWLGYVNRAIRAADQAGVRSIFHTA
jgi:hypothetical protein